MAFSKLDGFSGFTKVVVIPYSDNVCSSRLYEPPYIVFAATTWSPEAVMFKMEYVTAAAPVATAPAPAPVAGPVREEKVELVSGDGLKAYSVVCGSFGVKANAEGLKQYLDGQGYSAKVVYNPERNMYRVIAVSFDDRAQATQAKEEFKAKYPNRDDFQKAWLLYRVY